MDTLHGGTIGWDRRNWTIAAKSASSVTFKHVDDALEDGVGYRESLAIIFERAFDLLLEAAHALKGYACVLREVKIGLRGNMTLKVDNARSEISRTRLPELA